MIQSSSVNVWKHRWTGFLFSISYEPNFCYLVFCSIFSVSQFCLIVIRYSICIYGESRHMLFWIPQYLYVFVAQRPQQVPAVVHSWRCILCICVRKLLFVDDCMYLAFRSLDDVNMKESELTIYEFTWAQNTLSKSSTHPHPRLRLYRFVFFFSPLWRSALSFLVKAIIRQKFSSLV